MRKLHRPCEKRENWGQVDKRSMDERSWLLQHENGGSKASRIRTLKDFVLTKKDFKMRWKFSRKPVEV